MVLFLVSKLGFSKGGFLREGQLHRPNPGRMLSGRRIHNSENPVNRRAVAPQLGLELEDEFRHSVVGTVVRTRRHKSPLSLRQPESPVPPIPTRRNWARF